MSGRAKNSTNPPAACGGCQLPQHRGYYNEFVQVRHLTGEPCVAPTATSTMIVSSIRELPRVGTWSSGGDVAVLASVDSRLRKKSKKLSVRLVKNNQTREPLDREKIRRGIERACSKRPIHSSTIERVVQAIEADIYANFDSEVTSSQVGEIVLSHLAKLDEVAYIRFASVYRDFDDAQDFIRAITGTMGSKVVSSG